MEDYIAPGGKFWTHVQKTESCWNWTGALDRSGYGKLFYIKAHRAHRFILEQRGEDLKGRTVDHICGNHACVNPEHLRVSDTHAEARSVESYIARIERRSSAPDANGCMHWHGVKTDHGHGRFTIRGKFQMVHRVVYELLVAPIPEGMYVDHVCGTRDCVNIQHLRLVTPQQNAEHRVQLSPTNTSGFPGVSYSQSHGKWRATGSAANDVRAHLGYFTDPRDAYEAWRHWAKKNQPYMDDRLLSI